MFMRCSEFKCGLIRGLLALGGGKHCTEFNYSLSFQIVYRGTLKKLQNQYLHVCKAIWFYTVYDLQ